MARRALVPVLLVTLALAFFWPLVLHPGKVLYSNNSDVLAQHLPYKRFLARSWQETGEVPLWCPHSLGGTPFIHDPQVSIFYPPNLLLLLVPDRLAGAAFSWLIVIQVILGGLFAFAYGREEGLTKLGAFVTGAGYMLSGKWLLHLLAAGHSIVIGLAWLPLVLLCFERTLRRRRPSWAAASGAALALLVLGTHPQWTLYAVLFIAVWTVGTGIEGTHGGRAVMAGLIRWMAFGILMGLIALALAAIQLLPTLEATRYSCRYVMGVPHANDSGKVDLGAVFALGRWLGMVGPSVTIHPNWEGVAGIGLTWAMAAAAGAWLGGRALLHRTASCCAVFAFALGGGVLLQNLPVFGLFRGVSRMLLLTCLPVALLAGCATDFLPLALASARTRRRLFWLLGAVALFGLIYTIVRLGIVPIEKRYVRLYWVTLALTVPALLWLAAAREGWLARWRRPLWCAVLIMDLLALSWPHVEVSRQERVYLSSPTLDFLESRRDDRGRVLDAYSLFLMSPLGCGAPIAVNRGLYAVRGYNPLDCFRYKTYLRFISGTDAPAAPHEIVPAFPITNRRLLDLLGVRYLLQPADEPPQGPAWRNALDDATGRASYNYPYGGMHVLPPYTVYENDDVLPRAFTVPRADAMPEGHEREALLSTDFRKTVLVEGCDPADYAAGPEDGYSEARIVEYRPNQVRIAVDGDSPGWLVLTDMWFPGWHCTVDGEQRPFYPGNYLFRTVPLPAGKHDVVFRFLPASYLIGRRITLITLAGLACWAAVLGLRSLRSRRPLSPRRTLAGEGRIRPAA
jgi:hypothetical protein